MENAYPANLHALKQYFEEHGLERFILPPETIVCEEEASKFSETSPASTLMPTVLTSENKSKRNVHMEPTDNIEESPPAQKSGAASDKTKSSKKHKKPKKSAKAAAKPTDDQANMGRSVTGTQSQWREKSS